MRTFEFNDKGDWTLGLVEGADEIRQAVEHLLRIGLGEWFLNETIGLDEKPFFRKDYNQREMVAEVTRTIQEEPRVKEVLNVSIDIDKRSRIATVRFTANIEGGGVINGEVNR